MKYYQQHFIRLILQKKILQFGDFTLKSGRKSPYFFNAGLFNSGAILRQVGMYYAMTIHDSGLPYDVLFGPAYKGIPLVCSTAIALARYEENAFFAFNRKEPKDHGEGGHIIGAPLKGKILLIDDVITAGTAVSQAMQLVKAEGGIVSGLIVAFDRQERGENNSSVSQDLQKNHGIPVISIVSFNDLITFVEKTLEFLPFKQQLIQYREKYGAS